ncbi:MAG: 50S ribosomal protein L24 [Dehalococcoidia bacterium]
MAQRIKTGDNVLVISGKDKGKRGTVVRVMPKEGRVVVEGVHVITRHIRQRPGTSQAGLVQQEAPISLSKVMLLDPETQQPGRAAWRFLEDGTKERVVKSGKRS